MATPARRSSRLRSATPQNRDSTPQLVVNLSSLVEREETPNTGVQSILDSIASPSALSCKPAQESVSNAPFIPSPLKTPTTAPRPRPAPEEMHPSQFHNTAKKRQSSDTPSVAGVTKGRIRGHCDEPRDETPTKLAAAVSVDTPSKTQKTARMVFSSPNIEFKMTRPSSELSTEAQKMMDEVREQAARIKAELLSQRDEQVRKDDETDKIFGHGNRKIAKPRGKVGRFSDVHMEQFKKMDSIANHASSFRADRTSPGPKKSLKRSNSNAGLDSSESSLKQDSLQKATTKEKVEMPSSPAKRYKQQHVFSAKPISSPFQARPSPAGLFNHRRLAPSNSQMPSGLVTPTKASLARSSSAKSLGKSRSLMPSVTRSPSLRGLSTPTASSVRSIQTEGNHKYRNAFANTLTSVRSILKRPQLRFSDDPVKLVAGTHVSTPTHLTEASSHESKHQTLSTLPEQLPGTPHNRKEKHVNFTASTNNANDKITSSPDPTCDTPSPVKMNYPTLPGTGSPNPLRSNPISVAALPRSPGDFTFHVGQAIRFGMQPSTISQDITPTIRKVRPSTVPHIPTAFEPLSPSPSKLLTSIPHGIANRKRKRDSLDSPDAGQNDEENKENCNEGADDEAGLAGSPAKKARTMPASTPLTTANQATKMTPGKSPATIKARARTRANAAAAARTTPGSEHRRTRGFLSLSRLNALAMPKVRK